MDLIALWVSQFDQIDFNALFSEHEPADIHYLTEIIRYWNKLNFIVQKTSRSLKLKPEKNWIKPEILVYLTYRNLWEEASFSNIFKEINHWTSNVDQDSLILFYNKLSTFSWDIALKSKSNVEKISIKYAIPSFTVDRLLAVMNDTNIKRNIKAMDDRGRNGNFYIRMNQIKNPKILISELITRVIKEFYSINVPVKRDKEFPNILKVNVKDKAKVINSQSFKDQHIIIQDKASYSTVIFLDPKPSDMICDLCAAPGVKTSLIGNQTLNQGFIAAGDFHEQRTQEMKSFLQTYGIKNVHPLQWDGIHPPLQEKLFDKILLDAPCTGSGTFSTNPVLKWRQNERFLKRHIFLQKNLLTSALGLLKVGGTMVFSTCSLYPEEGEYQIQGILDDTVKLADTPSWLPPCYKINGSPLRGSGRFLPAEHQTLGFFISKLIKIKEKE
jgi:16S rRNA (cytosine967-C5)-methyltransferase